MVAPGRVARFRRRQRYAGGATTLLDNAERELVDIVGLFAHPPWMADALCLEYPPDWWFPSRGDPTERALAVCRRCAVREECLAFAIEHDQRDGIWGGTT